MPAVPVALAASIIAPAAELARAVAVKPYTPFSGPRTPEWHPGAHRHAGRPSDRPPVNPAGRTTLDPTTHQEDRMSTQAPSPSTKPNTETAPSPTPTRMGRPPISDIPPGHKTPQRQIRIADEDWYGAAAKAAEEGTTASAVIRTLLRAWRLGEIDLPE